MTSLAEKAASLSPERRKLLAILLKEEKGIDLARAVILPRPSSAPSVLSFAQERMWFLDRWSPGNPVYNISVGIHLQGPLHVEILEKSLRQVVRRHETLRTTFAMKNGQVTPTINPSLSLTLPVVDFQDWPVDEQESRARQLATEMARYPFDLTQGPLLQLRLACLGKEDHVLLLTMHHIISDGWSVGVLLREMATLYKAFSCGEPSPLAPLPIQYADFAHWQREWLQGEVLESLLSYWKRQLANTPSVLALATDRPRSAVQTFVGARLSITLSNELTHALKELGRQEGATLFMTLLAAFKVLLYRYTGQLDIQVGSPIANRNRMESEGLIGLFVNTLVLRTDLSGSPSFLELLARVRETVLNAYAHQDLPFDQVVAALQLERDLSRSPLFQVMFALQNEPFALEMPGLTASLLETDSGTAAFDLTLSLMETGGRLKGILEYNTDLFDAATVQRMMGHYQVLLESIVADPGRRISDLSLLTDDERRQLLFLWNDTGAGYPQGRCIQQLFEARVEETPDAVAVVFQDYHLTYRELNRRANRLAHYLEGLGVEPEVPVGVYMERSPEMVIGLLGTIKSGGVYVPLDPAYPKERLTFMLNDAQVSILLVKQDSNTDLSDARVVCLDADWPSIARERAENPVNRVTVDNLAYVIYTSGSTGKPKGSLVTHRGLPNLAHAQVCAFGVDSSSRVLQFSSASFDASIFEIVMALGSGATLCMVPRDALSPGPGLVRLLRDLVVTIVTLPPSVLAASPVKELTTLETITVAGEACSSDLVGRWAAGRRFFNLYGPTEATIWTTMAQCTDGKQTPPIGSPIANTQIYLMDEHFQLVPIGVPGELCIGGVSLGRGYLNRPEITAEKFVPNPFSDPPGARLYRTGDLARYRPDGEIEFLGRMDHQVKVRGFRIELEEIEATLLQYPGVRMAVALVQDAGREAGGKRLVVYVVANGEPALAVGDLRSFLQKKLPNYMVPAAFVVLKELPLMPSGKVDRQALLALEIHRPELKIPYVPPQTDVERTIADVWRQVLNLEQVGIHDSFFDLGGDSILVAKVHSSLEEIFGQELTLVQMFQYPTINSLARYLSHKETLLSADKIHDRARKQTEAMNLASRQPRRRVLIQ